MPNNGGRKILNELEFEKEIEGMDDRTLLEFVARQQYSMSKQCPLQDNRINNLEKGSKKLSSIAGGIAGLVAAIVAGIINYFVTKGN